MGIENLTPEWISIEQLVELDIDVLKELNENLQEAIAKAKRGELEGSEPSISIWYDKIGTEIHFDDGGMFCRDFSGNDTKYFITLMWLIANHRWKDAVKCIEEYFING